jgi:uncharacterized protein DUF6714
MKPEDLARCLEDAFGGLEAPCLKELAAIDTYMDESFEDAVKTDTARTKRWQDLRPMAQYIGDYSEIVLLSPRAYQYYLPAYLYALIDQAGDGLYLLGVLDSLWYEDLDGEILYGSPRMHDIWKERMALLTPQQKKCIAQILVKILERIDDRLQGKHSAALRIELMLKKYWNAWL